MSALQALLGKKFTIERAHATATGGIFVRLVSPRGHAVIAEANGLSDTLIIALLGMVETLEVKLQQAEDMRTSFASALERASVDLREAEAARDGLTAQVFAIQQMQARHAQMIPLREGDGEDGEGDIADQVVANFTTLIDAMVDTVKPEEGDGEDPVRMVNTASGPKRLTTDGVLHYTEEIETSK